METKVFNVVAKQYPTANLNDKQFVKFIKNQISSMEQMIREGGVWIQTDGTKLTLIDGEFTL